VVRVGGNDGQIAVIRGSEYGFLTPVPFGDQLAYITGTGTPENFEANRDLLFSIIESIHVPAGVPEPTATPLPGLGGLSGMPGETTEATEEVTEAAG